MTRDKRVLTQHNRRWIVGLGLGLIGGMALQPTRARAFAPPRKVALDNLHTGEKLALPYWADGQYLTESLREIDWLLRDHRNNAAHPIDPRLLDLLHALDQSLGTSRPYEVISGYRSPASNAMLAASSEGVARHSLHTQGMAIDIRVQGVQLAHLRDSAKALTGGGVGYYAASDFVHVDVGRVRYW